MTEFTDFIPIIVFFGAASAGIRALYEIQNTEIDIKNAIITVILSMLLGSFICFWVVVIVAEIWPESSIELKLVIGSIAAFFTRRVLQILEGAIDKIESYLQNRSIKK